MNIRKIVPWLVMIMLCPVVGVWRGYTQNDHGETIILDERFEERKNEFPAYKTYNSLSDDLLKQIKEGGRWHLILAPTAKAKSDVVEGSARVVIETSGPQWYAVQWAYLPLEIRPEKIYRISFRARAERNVTTVFDVGCVGGDWWSYSGHKRFSIGNDWQEFGLQFATRKMDDDENARLEFNFGNESENIIFIDDIQVIEFDKKQSK